MPCSPEMRNKAEKVLDSIATRMDSIMQARMDASEKDDSDPGEEETDTQDEPGNLGKRGGDAS